MASRNGLGPKIRGLKGVGFGRALPNVFSFSKGFIGNTSSDCFSVPHLVGQTVPAKFTVEFWTNLSSAWSGSIDNEAGFFGMKDTANKHFDIQAGGSPGAYVCYGQGTQANCVFTNVPGVRNHVVCRWDTVNNVMTSCVNGNLATMVTAGAGAYSPLPIAAFFCYFAYTNGFPGSRFMDEWRFYDVYISDQEIVTNYNGGIGNNPSVTEHLQVWYQFEQFETLDFSLAQDGSNMKLGMRDMSGKNNHGLPATGMNTTVGSGGYVLQTF